VRTQKCQEAGGTALLLSGQPLQWTQEATYLGVALKGRRTPDETLPLKLPRVWASLYKTGAALSPGVPLFVSGQSVTKKESASPAVPVPLAAQLPLVVTDALCPAAVRDLDYTRVDRFVANLVRRLTGCDKGPRATCLQVRDGRVAQQVLRTAARRSTGSASARTPGLPSAHGLLCLRPTLSFFLCDGLAAYESGTHTPTLPGGVPSVVRPGFAFRGFVCWFVTDWPLTESGSRASYGEWKSGPVPPWVLRLAVSGQSVTNRQNNRCWALAKRVN
jgi:hypothetical protein